MILSKPLVSVIISTYNSEQFIDAKLKDLIQQTFFDQTEIIIINSGSQQNEDAIIQPYSRQYANIKYFRTLERETIYKAFNRAIKMASGKYITNSNTDDRLRKDAIEIMVQELEYNSDVALVYADQYISSLANETFHEALKNEHTLRPDYSKLRILASYCLGSQSMWRASLHFIDGLWFDESYEIAGDYHFALGISEMYKFKRIDDCLGVYYKSPKGMNKEFQDMTQTIYETAIIRDSFSLKYFSTLSKWERLRLTFILNIYYLLPEIVFRLINRINFLVRKRKPLLSLDMAIYFLSFIYEIQGRYKEALSVCQKFNNRQQSCFLEIRITNLLERYNNKV